MDLTHSFTVPTGLDATWEHFGDIGGLAECFPGAQITSVAENEAGMPTFAGSVKVKLGPIALVYAGAGSFVERDAEAHRFVVEAKGRDKRGNGTAGATVTVAMTAEGEQATHVEVVTDLAITGKPAQFGRGVMQDVSDKLLGQFMTCLEQRLAAGEQPAGEERADGPAAEAAATDRSEDPSAGVTPAQAAAAAAAGEPGVAAAPPAPPATPPAGDALDLGATVVPVLVKSYGKQVAMGLLGLLLVVLVIRRLRR
ncbi:carbon monoxide dehydrogenase [Nocardioides sp. GY 10113]|uniref:SRPBCC family protein n=1 Tax=Nocardioides sp. GY 10113 TaxID=2569761 RepID=UPI0010A7A612|nr:SRPBCC family protein [Nocardioides sp. GY 10113]TIC85851.1 carbon monoxide dehydrogenase [Nocardioides sp. GY 10113]